METAKILKFRYPLSLFEMYDISNRKETTLRASFPSKNFVSRSTSMWNILAPKLRLSDYTYKISHVKSCLKKSLLVTQHLNDELAWLPDDTDIAKLTISNG